MYAECICNLVAINFGQWDRKFSFVLVLLEYGYIIESPLARSV